MKYVVILLLALFAGFLSGEHFHSFMAGFGIAGIAVGTAYWLAFRSTRYPQLALLLLLMGMMAKLAITVIGVLWGINNNVINSPFIFALSYLFFSIVISYGYFKLREIRIAKSN